MGWHKGSVFTAELLFWAQPFREYGPISCNRRNEALLRCQVHWETKTYHLSFEAGMIILYKIRLTPKGGLLDAFRLETILPLTDWGICTLYSH